MALLHHVPYPLRLRVAIEPERLRQSCPFHVLPDLRLQFPVSQHMYEKRAAFVPQRPCQTHHILRMFQRNKPPRPHDMQSAVLHLHGVKLLLTVSPQPRKIPPPEQLPRISPDQMKIRRSVSAGTQHTDILFPVLDMLLIFRRQPARRDRLPLAFSVKPLAHAHRHSAGSKPLSRDILPLRPAKQHYITFGDRPPARILVLVQTLHIGQLPHIHAPPHGDPLFLHGHGLDKSKIIPQFPPERLAQRHLMMVDII